MFKDEYQDYMSEVRPENSLVESMVEAQRNQRSQRAVRPVRAVRVAAAALCGLLVFSGGTIAVDAATNGGVQRLLGIKDSISVGTIKTEILLTEPEQKYDGSVETAPESGSVDAKKTESVMKEEQKDDTSMETVAETEHNLGISVESNWDEEGNPTMVVKSTNDVPVFSYSFSIQDGNDTFGGAYQLIDCVTADDFAWTVYARMAGKFDSIRNNEAKRDEVIAELECLKQEIGTGTEMKDGCAMGVQFVIDDLKTNRADNRKMVYIDAVDHSDADGDGNRMEWVGISVLKIDFDVWEKVTEETGKTEFETEAIAGVPGTYRFIMHSYEPLSYNCEPVY